MITSANPVIDDAHGPSPILKKDPFVIKANANARGPVTRRNSSQEIGPPAVEPRAVAATSVDGAGEELTLKAILMGNRPAAIIDGRIVRVGDRLDTSDGECHYNVTAITRDTVSLLAEWPKTGETKPITLGLDVKVADG